MSDNELTPSPVIHVSSHVQNTHSPLYFRLDPSIFKLVRRLQMVFAFVFLLAMKPDDEKKRRMRGNWFGIEGKGFERLRVLRLSCWHHIDVCEGFFKMKEWERTNEICSMNKEWMSDKERRKGNRDEETPPKLSFLPRYHTISERTPQRYTALLPRFIHVQSLQLEWIYYIIFNVLNIFTVHDETKGRLNSGNACYRSVQNILSSRYAT